MRIVFGVDLDDGGFPGPLGNAGDGPSAVLDNVWVGVDGLVATLEVRLGLTRLDPPGNSERAAHLARALQASPADAPWARSLAVDPFATARAVLRLKDALTMAGVPDGASSASLPPRLAAVHDAVRDGALLPGLPQRALAVCEALEGGASPRVTHLEVVDPPAALPRVVRRLLEALGTRGAVISQRGPPVPSSSGRDLDAVRGDASDSAGVIVGDGSLLFLRPDTIDEAADDVAAFLAITPEAVVIGGDAVLDEALARRGAPTLGARGDIGTDALLALLPLVVATGEDPLDPERLFELVGLPVSPLPRSLAGSLRRALTDTPSPTATTVLAALDDVLAHRELQHGADARTKLEDRLALVVPAWAPHLHRPVRALGGSDDDSVGDDGVSEDSAGENEGGVSVARLRERVVFLLQLLFGRQRQTYGDEERTPYRAAIRQVTIALKLIDSLGLQRLSTPQVARLIDSATRSVRPDAPWAAEAGLRQLRRPGALCGPAPVVVWWNFTRESGRLQARSLFAFERQQLLAQGFDPGSLDGLADAHADASRRPLLWARERLILVAPQRTATGREQHPHPLWDEIVARIQSSERRAALRSLVRPDDSGGARGLVARVPPTMKALPRSRSLHVFPAGAVLPKEVTSPSREELLLGCGVRFVLDERGAGSRSFRIKRGVTLEGDVVHAVIGAVLHAGVMGAVPTDDDATVLARAHAAYDATVGTIAGAWLRPGREQILLRVRERSARAATALVALLRDNQLAVRAVEQEAERDLPTILQGTPTSRILKGTPDLVVEGTDTDGRVFPFVIDHKTGREDHRRTLLRLGVPLQLLDYARLVGDPLQAPTGFGYFIIRSRRLLTADTRIRGVDHVGADRTAREGWRLIEIARAQAFTRLAEGTVLAPGADGAPVADIQVDVDNKGGERLVIGPPCAWCRADVICGRAWKESLG